MGAWSVGAIQISRRFTIQMGKISGFLKDVVSEMRKVSWPKRKELTRYTIVVLVTVMFMAVYFALTDLGISSLIEWYLEL